MKKVLLALVVTGLMGFGSGPVCAQMENASPELSKGEGPVEKIVSMEDQLGLKAEQKAKVEKIQKTFFEKQKGLHSEVKDLRQKMREELSSSNPNRKKLEGLVNDISKKHNQIMMNQVENVFSLKAVLSDEQYQNLRQMREERGKMRGERMKTMRQGRGSNPTEPEVK